MAKKSKKKTIASTRKKEPVSGGQPQPKQKKGKKFLKKTAKTKITKVKKSFWAGLFGRGKKAGEAGKLTTPTASKSVEEKKADKEMESLAAEIASLPASKPQPASDVDKNLTGAFGTSEEEIRKEKIVEEKARKIINEVKLKKRKASISPRRRQQIRGGLLTLIGLFALTFIGYFLFTKFFRPQPLAELLPAEQSLAFLEVNIDSTDYQPKQFLELLKNHPVYQRDNLIKLFDFIAPFDYSKDLEPWLGRKVGAALLNVPSPADGNVLRSSRSTLKWAFFIETRDYSKTLDSIKSIAMTRQKEEIVSQDYKNITVYSFKFSHSFQFAFLNNYLAASDNQETLYALIDSYTGGKTKLADTPSYQKVSNNLPHGGIAFGYLDVKGYVGAMAADPSFISQKGRYLGSLKPYLNMFNAIGLSIFADKDKFTAQTFTAINVENGQDKGYVTFADKYQGSLLSLIDETPVFLAGGRDLSMEINRLEQILADGSKNNPLLLSSMLEMQKQKYFGKAVSLKDDVYPLFNGEYLFSIANTFSDPQFTLLLTMGDPIKDPERVTRLVNEFLRTGGILTPHIQNVTLPDGTVGQEIVSAPEKLSRSDEDYNGENITVIKIGDTGYFIYLAQVKNRAIVTTSHDTAKKIVDRINGKLTYSFATTDLYKKDLVPMLRSADEVFDIQLGALTEALGLNDNQLLKPYLLPFTNLTVSKNYFTDGVSTIYFLRVI